MPQLNVFKYDLLMKLNCKQLNDAPTLEVYCCQAVLLGFVKIVGPHERNFELGRGILLGAGSSFFVPTVVVDH
uniref:Uncharacterized protein n=1 Tax=Strongyloides venezuelensis TaxID=75913 RepID=A0A0K0FYP8_STRVS